MMMHPLFYLMLLTSLCLAHYRGSYDTHNYNVREEPYGQDVGEIVECPVCRHPVDDWTGNREKCILRRDNTAYKTCKFGVYINQVCDGRWDCYSGPQEECTVKRNVDMYGKKCAPGYYCHKTLGVCTAPGFQPESPLQWQLRFPYGGRRFDLNESQPIPRNIY